LRRSGLSEPKWSIASRCVTRRNGVGTTLPVASWIGGRSPTRPSEDDLLVGKGDLEVELGELGLAVGAQFLVAHAARAHCPSSKSGMLRREFRANAGGSAPKVTRRAPPAFALSQEPSFSTIGRSPLAREGRRWIACQEPVRHKVAAHDRRALPGEVADYEGGPTGSVSDLEGDRRFRRRARHGARPFRDSAVSAFSLGRPGRLPLTARPRAERLRRAKLRVASRQEDCIRFVRRR